ncbi:MAG: hypothetical protein KAZ48_11455, partial [Candidatus Nanopelagicales bacterium]|nr:hypothetical protein [Candidatus Nanopelagicales bacterium]
RVPHRMDGREMTLTFLTVCWLAGFVAWVTDRRWPWTETAAAIPAAIIAGLGAGIFLAAWSA